MIDRLSGPSPSITRIYYQLFAYIANHPLIIRPPIRHPINGETVRIERYRLFNGIETNQGLTCSIFPHYIVADPTPAPTTTNSTVIYEPYDIGQGIDRAIYHICVKLHYPTNAVGNKITNELTTVPKESVTHPDQYLHTSSERYNVDLYINPGLDILGEYLELLRLILVDKDYLRRYDLNVNSVDVSLLNLKSSPWDKEKSIYFHTGELLLRLDAFISRGWRNRFLSVVKDINLISSPNMEGNNNSYYKNDGDNAC